MTGPWTELRAIAQAVPLLRPSHAPPEHERLGHERIAPERLARLFVVLVGISILGITAWRVQAARDLALWDGRTQAANVARSLAEHTHAMLQTATLVTAELV